MEAREGTRSAPHRSIGLDVLRAAAIGFVLLAHVPLDGKDSLLWFAFGMWGVELFFVLSGFLITGLLYRVFDDFSVARIRVFFVRRWMRTLPFYYVAIVLIIGLEGGILGRPIVDLERYLLFVQTVPTGEYGWFSVSWSLSIEEWSYILYPCIAAALWFVRGLDGRFALIFLSAIVLFTAYRLSLGEMGVPYDTNIRRALVPRLDALAYGGLLRVFWTRYREQFYAVRQPLLALSILGQAVCLQVFLAFGTANSLAAAGLLTILPICLCLCFPFAISIRRAVRPVRLIFFYFASRSYALYLFHHTFFTIAGSFAPAVSTTARVAVAMGVAFIVADLAYRWIEKPIMDRRPAEPQTEKPDAVTVRA